MRDYKDKFKIYLDDLAKDEPAPGGGSVVSLVFCAGVSLIEKAARYSFRSKAKIISSKAKTSESRRRIGHLKTLRRKVYPYIDKDGYIFEKIMSQKGHRKGRFIREGEKIIVNIGMSCWEVFLLAKGMESGIKKSIISDFYIGLELVKCALEGCIFNLKANERMFSRKTRYASVLSNYLKKWQKS